ncbi:SGNH/GDSL hydrolase family protein [Arthrobacter sp. ISL-72]|nr:SGNH/GDSL hydrolase family protein [Arthrobacter sp. ISL-72]
MRVADGPRPAGHVVLLGDSIFDNKAYVGEDPGVIMQLREELPPGWKATMLALDGDVIAGVRRQLRLLPEDATHLVVSVGGNDALGFAHLLQMPAGDVTEALNILAAAQDDFAAGYQAMAQAVASTGLPSAVCTIYDTPSTGPGYRTIRTALAIFNDCITRAAFGLGISLIDLRLICGEDGDYANPIEPSALGGAKIARAIAFLVKQRHQADRTEVIAAPPS